MPRTISRPWTALALAWILCAPLTAAEFVRGDLDANGSHELTDAVRVFGFLFLGDTPPSCEDAADVDDSSEIDVTDGIYLLGFLFQGGPQPPAPFDGCGSDATADALDCLAFAGCAEASGCTLAGQFECIDDDDTDGDGLLDCDEAEFHGTSPLHADSDGDGLDDRTEERDFTSRFPTISNPLIADVPQLRVELVGVPSIRLEKQIGQEQTEEITMTEGEETSLAVETSQTDTRTRSVEQTTTHTLGAQQEFSLVPPKFGDTTVSYEASFSNSTTDETSVSWSRGSTETLSRFAERATSEARTSDQRLVGGKIRVGVLLRNIGEVPLRVRNFGLTALLRNPENRDQFDVIANLGLQSYSGDLPAMGRRGEANDAVGPVSFEADLTLDDALALLRDPNGLVLQVSGFDLDVSHRPSDGVPFFVNWVHNATALRTAPLIVDYGPDREQERHLVATNVHFDGTARRPSEALGVCMSELLQEFLHLEEGVDYSVSELQVVDAATGEPTGNATRKLTGFRGVESNPEINGFWTLSSNSQSLEDDPYFYDFDELVVRSGEVFHLVYVEDRDGDGLGHREEHLYGTDDSRSDSDDDGLGDFEETRHGWTVTLIDGSEPYTAFANPASADGDADGLDDSRERELGTDPRLVDTDGDSHSDGDEDELGSDPLDPNDPPVTTAPYAHYAFDELERIGGDRRVADVSGHQRHGFAEPGGPLLRPTPANRGDDAAFRFDRTGDEGTIINLGRQDLEHSFSLAAWVNRDIEGTGDLWIVGERDVFGLTIERSFNGRAGFFVRDEFGKPMTVRDPVRVFNREWHHFAVSVSYDEAEDETTIDLYRDGELAVSEVIFGPVSTWNREMSIGAYYSGPCTRTCGTTVPIGCCSQTYGAFRGWIDEVRLYDVAISPANVAAIAE